jgi:citrate synthase
MKKVIDGFPSNCSPYGDAVLITSALIAFNPKSVNVDSEEDMYKAIVKLLAKFPTLAAWTLRKKEGHAS